MPRIVRPSVAPIRLPDIGQATDSPLTGTAPTVAPATSWTFTEQDDAL